MKAFLFDQARCVGCSACSVACKVKNDLPVGLNFRKVEVFEVEKDGRFVEVFLTHACMHCKDPQCLKVCPTSAYTKRDDGIVLHDKDRCVGCGYCIYACPYQAISFDARTKKVAKCDMCVDLQDKGELPACVSGCPVQVHFIGELNELDKSGATNKGVGFPIFECDPSMRFINRKA